MKEITYFYLANCPYCRQADRIIADLIKETPQYAAVSVNKIEETRNPEISNKYDYHYVPCLWIGSEKLHEGVPTKEKIRRVFDAAISE